MSDWKALVKDVVSKLSIEALRDIVYGILTSKEEDISSEDSTCSINSFGSKTWRNKKGELHRIDGPAIECADGSKYWFVNDKLHREDGPAIESYNGEKSYWLNGEWFTEDDYRLKLRTKIDLPEDSTCYIDCHGIKIWTNKNGQYHRIDGPAIEYVDGSKFWYKNGLLHRTDGPACEYASGRQYWYLSSKRCWYLNGEKMTEEEFDKAVK